MIFSVIVPFLNEEVYIEQCILSLINQDFDAGEYEILFVDNGSTDASAEIVRKYPRVILLEEKKRDPYAARNKALSYAKGQIMAFTDADCIVSKDWLAQIHKGMQEANVTIVLGRRCFSDNHSIWLRMFQDYENAKVEYIIGAGVRECYFGFTNNMAVRAEAFKKWMFFAELPVAGDTEFIHKCLQDPATMVTYLPRMIITHLEVTALAEWLKKVFFYGEINLLMGRKWGYRALRWREKLKIFHRCALDHCYNFCQAALFLSLLAIGQVFYAAGELKGKLKQ